ncbi:MAG TPA: Hpt domain-containing protein [Caulobacteraceae bacterium]
MNDQLQVLKLRFLERCSRDLALIERALEDPAVSITGDFVETLHKLSGSAGSFGYPAISELAGRVDDELMSGAPPSRESLLALAQGLRGL